MKKNIKNFLQIMLLLALLSSCTKGGEVITDTPEATTQNTNEMQFNYNSEIIGNNNNHIEGEKHEEGKNAKFDENGNKIHCGKHSFPSGVKEEQETKEVIKEDPKNTELKIKISPTCIGCGKCVVVAVANFKMNNLTYKAEVISQDNLDSSEVKTAINICPVNSISIG